MNRGFLYGDGFFETIRVLDGSIPLMDSHLERIEDAMIIYKLEPKFEISEDFIRSIASEYESNGSLRINFFRDGGGTYSPETNDVAFNHLFTPQNKPFFVPTSLDFEADLKNAPVSLGTTGLYPAPKPNVSWMTVKSLSSMYYVLAAQHKKEKKLDYLFIQNEEGHICEELISNILIQKGENFFIPSIASGGVNGATQRFLFRNYGFAITEKKLTIKDLETADAVYLCKGSTGVIKVRYNSNPSQP
ncbi:aminotransferase class IV [Bacteroidia bacterium]|nr:aminotransferase class IV [Bacteroidia bacterium]MDC1395365.1 aminotransferase class IV [Bacteroidia bacterium]